MENCVVAVASGKGGTGKTLVAVNLAAQAGGPLALLDCDVEEPNGHLFLKPEWDEEVEATVPVPEVDGRTCTGCGRCIRACRFNALALLGPAPLFFPELCHSCGACLWACSHDALREVEQRIGLLRRAAIGDLEYHQGLLDLGQTRATSLIEAVRRRTPGDRPVLLDAPPGCSCPVVATVRGVDYLVLVTEPTPFGRHDLALALEMGRSLGLAIGVVINRAGADGSVRKWCRDQGLPVLAEIPDRREVAELAARGEIVSRHLPWLAVIFKELWQRIGEEVAKCVRS